MRLIKGSHAPSSETDLRGLTSASADKGRCRASQCLHEQSGCRSLTCLHGIVLTVGVQSPPKLSTMVDYTERGKVVPSPGASPGRYHRKAYCWSGDNENVGKSKGGSVMEPIERNFRLTLNTKASVSVEQSAHVQHGVSLRENLENL